MLHHRMTKMGLGRMPHIASNVVDQEAVKLIADWIAGMKKGEAHGAGGEGE
jgi:hypothetical protein